MNKSYVAHLIDNQATWGTGINTKAKSGVRRKIDRYFRSTHQPSFVSSHIPNLVVKSWITHKISKILRKNKKKRSNLSNEKRKNQMTKCKRKFKSIWIWTWSSLKTLLVTIRKFIRAFCNRMETSRKIYKNLMDKDLRSLLTSNSWDSHSMLVGMLTHLVRITKSWDFRIKSLSLKRLEKTNS